MMVASAEPNSLGDVLRLARGHVVVLFALSVTSNILMLTGSIFMLQVYDLVIPSRSAETLAALTALVVVLFGFYAVIEWIRARMAGRIGGLLHDRLAQRLFPLTMRMRINQSHLHLSNPVQDLDQVRLFISGPGAISLLDIPWVPIYLALAFYLHPWLGTMALAGGLVMTLLLVLNELNSHRPAMATTAASGERAALGRDADNNAESIFAMGMQDAVTRRWARASGQLVRTQMRSSDRVAFYSSITKGFRFLLQSAVLALGAYLVIQNQATGGIMIAASILTSRALAPMEQVVAHWRSFVSARQAGVRINRMLKASGQRERPTRLPIQRQTLSVENLSTGINAESIVARGVTFTLNAGDGLGIIGPSGAGKSSIARALVGVWPVLSGAIRLDGAELAHFDPGELGAAIGYLPQSVELLNGTIAENICRFDASHDTEAILAAAQATGVHDLIASLPNGYETNLSAHGSNLSAGQRQRIGLARALYGNPFLVVLDEPNSNLDMEGDEALTLAIEEARRRGSIVIVVAHRPSAISAVDKLLFMRDGRQVAFGGKGEVLDRVALPASQARDA
ncbi:type I secretion system permease/ATPase [Devosia sp. A369]